MGVKPLPFDIQNHTSLPAGIVLEPPQVVSPPPSAHAPPS